MNLVSPFEGHLHFSSYHVLCYKYCHKAEVEADPEAAEADHEWGIVRRHRGVSVTMGDPGDMATIAGILATMTSNTKVRSNIKYQKQPSFARHTDRLQNIFKTYCSK